MRCCYLLHGYLIVANGMGKNSSLHSLQLGDVLLLAEVVEDDLLSCEMVNDA